MTSVPIANLSFFPLPKPDGNITDPHKSGGPDASTIIRLTISTFVFVLTIAGNGAAIYFLSKKKDLLGLKNYYYGYYLINLSVSDILVAVLCIPFTVIYYESQSWPLGALMCKVMPTLQVMAVTTSVGTLVVITFDRHQAILHPMKPRAGSIGIKIKIACIWIWSFSIGAPSLYANKYDPNLKKYQCQEIWPKQQYRQIYTILILCFDYILPLLLIIVWYAKIMITLRKNISLSNTDESRNLHRRFLRSTAFLVASFAVCYLPAKVCFVVMDFQLSVDPEILTTVLNYSHVLIWFNSCLNPFIYGTVHGFFRNTIKRNISILFTSFQETQMTESLRKARYASIVLQQKSSKSLKEDELKQCSESAV